MGTMKLGRWLRWTPSWVTRPDGVILDIGAVAYRADLEEDP